MSEIFSWLKKAELERKRPARERTAIPPVALQEAPPKVPGPGEIREPVPSSPDGTGIHPAETLDLSSADPKYRLVIDASTMVGEQYRLLRAKLSLMQKESGLKTLLVTSALPGEGKTFTACALAGVLAQEPGRNVLIIDADLRNPAVERTLNGKRGAVRHGLTQALQGGVSQPEALILATSEDGLYFLPSGPVPDNPSELLGSERLEQLLASLRPHFAWIVLDSPPALSLADASLLSVHCDAALLVIQAERTPASAVTDLVQMLGEERICGAVLNRTRQMKSSHYYYSYYRKEK